MKATNVGRDFFRRGKILLSCHPFEAEYGGEGEVERLSAVLVEATPPEVVGYDDVCHSVEHELHILCICGAGHVTVDLFGG